MTLKDFFDGRERFKEMVFRNARGEYLPLRVEAIGKAVCISVVYLDQGRIKTSIRPLWEALEDTYVRP
ncbi:MAG: hypothetical protein AABY16_03055 [Nanoarchaeota archaeon]